MNFNWVNQVLLANSCVLPIQLGILSAWLKRGLAIAKRRHCRPYPTKEENLCLTIGSLSAGSQAWVLKFLVGLDLYISLWLDWYHVLEGSVKEIGATSYPGSIDVAHFHVVGSLPPRKSHETLTVLEYYDSYNLHLLCLFNLYLTLEEKSAFTRVR